MLFVLIILIILAYIVNNASQKHALEKLTYKRVLSKTVMEPGEEFDVTTIIENRKRMPVTFLQVTEVYPAETQFRNKVNSVRTNIELINKSTMLIMGYQRIKRTYKMDCMKRGKYLFDNVMLTAGDALGLAVIDKELEYINEFIVLPERYPLEEKMIPYGEYNGNVSVKRWIIEDPVLTVGIREYTGLEPQKNIHWTSSLKYNKLMVKKFDFTIDNKALIMLNIETYKPFWFKVLHDKIETCISIARSVAEEFESSKIPYAFYSNSLGYSAYSRDVMYPGLGPSHLNEILQILGRLGYSIETGFDECLLNFINQNSSYTTFTIITPIVLDEYVDNINTLSKKCERLILFTLDNKNLDKLENNIIAYVERGDIVE